MSYKPKKSDLLAIFSSEKRISENKPTALGELISTGMSALEFSWIRVLSLYSIYDVGDNVVKPLASPKTD